MIKMKAPEKINIRTIKVALIIPLFLLAISAVCLVSSGYNSYAGDIDGGLNGDCDVCHPPGDFVGLNSYGVEFAELANHTSDSRGAIIAIGGSDSDGDGFINRHELENASNPGDINDIPTGIPKVPHLHVSDVFKSPEKPEVGKKLLLYIRIANDGDADADGVTVQLIENGEEADDTLTDVSIYKFGNQTVIFSLEPEEGNHKYEVEITYSEGTVSETIYLGVLPEQDTSFFLPFPGTMTILLLIFTLAGLIKIGLRFTGGGRH